MMPPHVTGADHGNGQTLIRIVAHAANLSVSPSLPRAVRQWVILSVCP